MGVTLATGYPYPDINSAVSAAWMYVMSSTSGEMGNIAIIAALPR